MSAPAATNKNLLWIMTDQHRADCLGCMGHPAIQTPNIDWIAAEGVLFENAFCQSPVCMSSRASLFTGRYPTTVRVRGMGVLPPAETTLPEWLQRQGYVTGAFGKVHFTPEQYSRRILGLDSPSIDWKKFALDAAIRPVPDDIYKENYGFNQYIGYEDILHGEFESWLKAHCPELLAQNRPESLYQDGPGDLFVSPYPSEFHPSTFITEQTMAFIREQARSRSPWMAFCSFVAPHHPFEAPADQLARYQQSDLPLPDWKGGVEPEFIPSPAAAAIGEMSENYSEEVQRSIIHHYLASISLIDDNVGQLLITLEQLGQLDNTIIIFVSDHGEFLGNHGLLRKPSLHYDETLRVPLIMRDPAIGAGRRVSGMVELVDVYPTLLGLLGLPVNPGVQGIDWSEKLGSGEKIARDDIYADMFTMEPMRFATMNGPYTSVQTIRTENWKLNLYPGAGQEYGQLFDLSNDPDESCNLYADRHCRDIREQLMWRLLNRLHMNTDPLPLWLTQY